MKKGFLIVISGPSGVGKGTIRQRLVEKYKELNLQYSISMTTRSPREGEENGREYFFVTKEQFEENIKNNNLIEYTKFVGNYYGTPRDYVEELRLKGFNVILEIEIEGARKVMKDYMNDNLITIFVTARSLRIIEERIRNRRTESEEQITERLNKAKKEMHLSYLYDYVVVNDEVEKSVDEIAGYLKTNMNL